MRKIVLLEHVTLDGYLAGPAGDMSFIRFDEELERTVGPVTAEAGGMIWGRKTYEMMVGFWPTVLQAPDRWSAYHQDHARWLETADKVVVSRTLTDGSPWDRTSFVPDLDPARIRALQDRPGGDLLVIGSASVARALIGAGLIDEWRLMVNPTVLGRGEKLFPEGFDRQDLQLVSARTLGSGVQVVHLRR